MKIGYFGDGPWAHEAFKKISTDDTLEIEFIVLRYDKQDEVLMHLAEESGIPVELHTDINSEEFLNRIKEYGAELFVSMSFNQIFKKSLINLPIYKTINCHAGKLPFYRGRNILNWVLINDEREFGITVHYMDEGIDTGDIILQKTYPITDEDDYGTLLERAYNGCAELLYQAIKNIQENRVNVICQTDIDSVGMYCGMRQPGDEIINWHQSSRELFNFIRALSKPGPQATAWIRGEKIQINRARMVSGAHAYKNIPGQVIGKTAEGFLVKTEDTMIEVIEYSFKGKIKVGDRLRDHER